MRAPKRDPEVLPPQRLCRPCAEATLSVIPCSKDDLRCGARSAARSRTGRAHGVLSRPPPPQQSGAARTTHAAPRGLPGRPPARRRAGQRAGAELHARDPARHWSQRGERAPSRCAPHGDCAIVALIRALRPPNPASDEPALTTAAHCCSTGQSPTEKQHGTENLPAQATRGQSSSRARK